MVLWHRNATLMAIFAFSTNQDTCTQVSPFLVGKKLFLSGFESEIESDLMDWIHEAGGEIVDKNFADVVDFAIVPFDASVKLSLKAKEVVTNLWMEGEFTNLFCVVQNREHQSWFRGIDYQFSFLSNLATIIVRLVNIKQGLEVSSYFNMHSLIGHRWVN